MNNLDNSTILQKLQKTSWAIMFFMTFVIMLQTCSTRKKTDKALEMIEQIHNRVDSLPTLPQIEKQFRIEGLEISKRMLYDNNAIVRTVIRPDDKMNEYDQEIKKLKTDKQ